MEFSALYIAAIKGLPYNGRELITVPRIKSGRVVGIVCFLTANKEESLIARYGVANFDGLREHGPVDWGIYTNLQDGLKAILALDGHDVLRMTKTWRRWLEQSWDGSGDVIPVPPESLRRELLEYMPSRAFAKLYDDYSGGYWTEYIDNGGG